MDDHISYGSFREKVLKYGTPKPRYTESTTQKPEQTLRSSGDDGRTGASRHGLTIYVQGVP